MNGDDNMIIINRFCVIKRNGKCGKWYLIKSKDGEKKEITRIVHSSTKRKNRAQKKKLLSRGHFKILLL